MSPYDTAVQLHVAAGTLALLAFWGAALLRKGSARHRIVGRLYLGAMLAVMGSAIPLALGAFQRGRPVLGTFLLYLLLLTGVGCWLAWRAVRDRRRIERYTGPVYRTLAWMLLGGGVLVLALGVRHGASILIVLGLVGIVSAPQMLRFAARPPAGRGWWLSEHYGAIVGCGIATHIAFFNLGLMRLWPGGGTVAQQLAWFAPIALGIAAQIWLDRRYGHSARSGDGVASDAALPQGR